MFEPMDLLVSVPCFCEDLVETIEEHEKSGGGVRQNLGPIEGRRPSAAEELWVMISCAKSALIFLVRRAVHPKHSLKLLDYPNDNRES